MGVEKRALYYCGITTSWPANQSDAKLLEGGVPCQNERSFIADDHISYIRIKFPKLSTTCMRYKHYVQDFTHG